MSNIFSKAFNKLTKEDNFKEKAHILIDVDGVQRNIVSKAINIYNTKYKPENKLKYEDWNVYHFPDLGGMPLIKHAGRELFFPDGKYTKDIFNNSEPYAGAVEGMKLINEKFNVSIVTAQFPENRIYTCNWLEKYEIECNGLIFIKDKHFIKGNILIDDRTDNLINWKVSNPNGIAIAIDQPWNKDWTGYRFKNLIETYNFIKTIY